MKKQTKTRIWARATPEEEVGILHGYPETKTVTGVYAVDNLGGFDDLWKLIKHRRGIITLTHRGHSIPFERLLALRDGHGSWTTTYGWEEQRWKSLDTTIVKVAKGK